VVRIENTCVNIETRELCAFTEVSWLFSACDSWSWALPKENKAKEMTGFGVLFFTPVGIGLPTERVIRRGA
jgi:hypothetical protein